MRNRAVAALPALVLGLGCLGLLKVGRQTDVPLRSDLEALPRVIDGAAGVDREVSADEQRVAGMDDYLMRIFVRDSLPAFSVYVGYYQAQTQGKSIHSPKNCLPGAGWEPIDSRPEAIAVEGRTVTVNRYLLEKGDQRAVVYYWYQGRGRTAWNEYAVKWELLRDKALLGRSDEALVRVVAPVVPGSPGQADSVAAAAVRAMVPALFEILAPVDAPLPARQAASR